MCFCQKKPYLTYFQIDHHWTHGQQHHHSPWTKLTDTQRYFLHEVVHNLLCLGTQESTLVFQLGPPFKQQTHPPKAQKMQKPCHWEHPEKDTCLRHASWHPKSASLCPSSVRNDTSSNWGFQGSTFICEQLQRLWVHWCEADSYIWASGWFPEYGISQQGKSTLYDSPCWREHAGATKSPT